MNSPTLGIPGSHWCHPMPKRTCCTLQLRTSTFVLVYQALLKQIPIYSFSFFFCVDTEVWGRVDCPTSCCLQVLPPDKNPARGCHGCSPDAAQQQLHAPGLMAPASTSKKAQVQRAVRWASHRTPPRETHSCTLVCSRTASCSAADFHCAGDCTSITGDGHPWHHCCSCTALRC